MFPKKNIWESDASAIIHVIILKIMAKHARSDIFGMKAFAIKQVQHTFLREPQGGTNFKISPVIHDFGNETEGVLGTP